VRTAAAATVVGTALTVVNHGDALVGGFDGDPPSRSP
jgi:hypothetical protein